MENMVCFTCLAVLCLFVAGIAAQECDTNKMTECSKFMESTDTSMRCENYNKAKTCLEGLQSTCSSNAMYANIMQGVTMYGAGCDGGSNSGAGGVVMPESCLMEASTCTQILNENGGNTSDPTLMCVNYKQFKACWDPVALKCKDNEQFIEMNKNFASMLTMCESDCDLKQLQGCLSDIQKADMTLLSTVKELQATCQAINTFQQCFGSLYESCKTVIVQQPDKAKMIEQQQDMSKKMSKLICVDNLPKLMEYKTCIDNDTVQAGFRKCEKMYGSPKLDDKGMPMTETEKEQCQRMGDMDNCLFTAISACGEKVTEIFVNLNKEVMKIKVAGENLECPTDAAAGLGGHVWMIIFTVAMAAFFY